MAEKKDAKPAAKKNAAKQETETNTNNVEIFDDGEIITLYDDHEKEVKFKQIACVDYQGDFFVLLQPAEKIAEVAEDEVIIFKLKEGKENDMFVPVDSEELLNNVFEQYLKAAADDNACGCGCGCDDEDCDGCGKDEEEDGCDCGCKHK